MFLAAKMDDTAQCSLGVMYYKGYGVEKNYDEAYKYFSLATKKGDANAQNNLGNCYYNGQGVKQNYEEAVRYYKLAAAQGNEYAINMLSKLNIEPKK